MLGKMRKFAANEVGNVTIDWTVIVGMVVGLSFALKLSIGGGVSLLGDATETELVNRNTGF